MSATLARRRQIVLAWLPVVAYTLLIWWLSSQQIDFKVLERVPFQDKGVHFLEYGALSFFTLHAIHISWPDRGLSGIATATLITIGLGILDELHQSFVPGRSSDVHDLGADAIGALIAALSYASLIYAYQSFRRDRDSVRRSD